MARSQAAVFARLLDNPLARPGMARDVMLWLPGWTLCMVTWGTLVLEILFAPLALSRRLRPWVWLAMCGLHLGIIAVVDFADLSFGMLMVHLFVFDRRWLGSLREVTGFRLRMGMAGAGCPHEQNCGR